MLLHTEKWFLILQNYVVKLNERTASLIPRIFSLMQICLAVNGLINSNDNAN